MSRGFTLLVLCALTFERGMSDFSGRKLLAIGSGDFGTAQAGRDASEPTFALTKSQGVSSEEDTAAALVTRMHSRQLDDDEATCPAGFWCSGG